MTNVRNAAKGAERITKVRNAAQANPLLARLKRLNYANIAVYIVLILISYQFMYPLLRMFTLSIMSPDDVINPAVNWVPTAMSFSNFNTAWNVMNPRVTMFNSLWFSGLLAVSQTLVSATTGYALARFEFPLKRFWFFMIIMSFILPVPVMLIPRTLMFFGIQDVTGIQMFGTIWPQTAMALGGQGIFSAILILIFYNFTRMIPFELDEAASIDGANAFQSFYHVILKLSVTTLLVVFLFSFVWNWNETFITSTFMGRGMDLIPGQLGMFSSLFDQFAGMGGGGGGGIGVGEGMEAMRLTEAYRMSGTLIAIFPLFVLYLIVQRQFIKGIENTGLTGL